MSKSKNDLPTTETKEEEYSPEAGPLPKSVYTLQLEALTRKLLENISFKLIKGKTRTLILFDDDQNPYNITEIMKYANVEHLNFTTKDFDDYSNYIGQSIYFSKFNNADHKAKYPELHLAEMKAICLYTGNDAYRSMNALLRGTYSFPNSHDTKRVILNSVFCGSGLSKIPDTTVPNTHLCTYSTVYRGERLFNQSVHDARIAAVSSKKTMELDGFISSSEQHDIICAYKVHWEISAIKGKNVIDLSVYPKEKEFLIPPTQIRINEHTFNNGVHTFKATPVTDVAALDIHKKITSNTEVDTLNLLLEISEYLNQQIERINSPGFIKWLKIQLGYVYKEVIDKKTQGMQKCIESIKSLETDILQTKMEDENVCKRLDTISRAIEDAASIELQFLDTTKKSHRGTKSSKFFQAVKTQIDDHNLDANVEKTDNPMQELD